MPCRITAQYQMYISNPLSSLRACQSGQLPIAMSGFCFIRFRSQAAQAVRKRIRICSFISQQINHPAEIICRIGWLHARNGRRDFKKFPISWRRLDAINNHGLISRILDVVWMHVASFSQTNNTCIHRTSPIWTDNDVYCCD